MLFFWITNSKDLNYQCLILVNKQNSTLEDHPHLLLKRFPWLLSLNNSMRIYNEVEKNKLDAKSRGFIMFMENMGQLSASQREIVIDQVMSLEDSKLTIDDLKWVVMMVIGNSTEAPVPAQWIESIVFYDDNPTLQ